MLGFVVYGNDDSHWFTLESFQQNCCSPYMYNESFVRQFGWSGYLNADLYVDYIILVVAPKYKHQ